MCEYCGSGRSCSICGRDDDRRARRAVDAGCLALFVAGLVMVAVAAWLM